MVLPLDARHIAGEAGSFVPQHTDNWSIEIAGIGDDQDLLVLSISAGALPSESSDEIEVPHGNTSVFYAGKGRVETIPLTVKDWVDRKVRKALVDWRRQVINFKTGAVGLPTDYKKTADMILFASDGTLERKCKLFGLWPQAMVGGTLDMAGSDQVLIEMTLRYDWPEWELE